MNKKFKATLVGLGLVTTTGLMSYLGGERAEDYLTYEEYEEIVQAYNIKLEAIRDNCENDTRCTDFGEYKQVDLGMIATKKDITKVLDKWMLEDDEVYHK